MYNFPKKQVKYCDGKSVCVCVCVCSQPRRPTTQQTIHDNASYKTGGFYSGDIKQPVKYKNATLYFRGRYIHSALVNSLMDMYV